MPRPRLNTRQNNRETRQTNEEVKCGLGSPGQTVRGHMRTSTCGATRGREGEGISSSGTLQPGRDPKNLTQSLGLEERRGAPLPEGPATGPAPPWTRCSVPLAALHCWSPPDTRTAAVLLMRHPKDGEMGPWTTGGLPRGEKHQRYLCSDPAPVGALLGFTWGSTVRRGMEEALPETAWS